MSSREDILGRVRAGLNRNATNAAAGREEMLASLSASSHGPKPAIDASPQALLERFRIKSEVQSSTVDIVAQESAVPAAIARYLTSMNLRKVAVAWQSLAALDWLRGAGARQFFFKYCSTFDSTERGNIGPVADALMTALGTDLSIACPAFPENGRSVFRGHLFVGDVLLSESGMQNHPLTPMTDANLVRVLQRQTQRRVGLARFDTVAGGEPALRARFDALRNEGCGIAIVDALSNDDLMTIGAACADMPLLTGGSGVALGLPRNFAAQGLLGDAGQASRMPAIDGAALVVAGSCSGATQGQVAHWRESGRPALRIDPLALAAGDPVVAQALVWAREHLSAGPVLVLSLIHI